MNSDLWLNVEKDLGGDEKEMQEKYIFLLLITSTYSSPGSSLLILKILYLKKFSKHTESKEKSVWDLYGPGHLGYC